MYGKINNILDKINKKYKINMGLPRLQCATVQKFKKMEDIIIGKMYNIPAISNGIDTSDKNYFFVMSQYRSILMIIFSLYYLKFIIFD